MPEDNQQQEGVKITLDGLGVTYKGDVSAVVAAQILRLCLAVNNVGIDSKTTSSLNDAASPSSERISLGEYVQKYQPTSYPEKILAIAAYQKEFKGRESFAPEDIRPLFRTIGDVPPANFGRDFRTALGNSWIAPDESDPNAFYVTTLGMKALGASFSVESVRKRKTRKRRRNGKEEKTSD